MVVEQIHLLHLTSFVKSVSGFLDVFSKRGKFWIRAVHVKVIPGVDLLVKDFFEISGEIGQFSFRVSIFELARANHISYVLL